MQWQAAAAGNRKNTFYENQNRKYLLGILKLNVDVQL